MTSSNQRIFLAFILCLLIMGFGTFGYIAIEDYSWFEALYMTVITITTVGFGEVKTLSHTGQGFTIILILIGFCSLAFVGQSFVESIMEKILNNSSETRKMLKKISRLKSHFIMCGFGRVGEAAAEHFKAKGVDFVVIEANPDHCAELQEKNILFIEGDATKEDLLIKAGIKNAAGLVALINTDPENLFIVLSARELNPTLHIISRAMNVSSEHKLLQAGADSVISPFKTAGLQVAEDILLATGHLSISETLQEHPQSRPQWIKVNDGSSLQNKTIAALAHEMGKAIIGFRRNNNDKMMPSSDTVILAGDTLLILESQVDAEPIDPSKNQPAKIIIIDDNPVIVRLYVRLFQKAGFHPLTAKNGQQGLELILSEKPAAAVIDYKLPILSGIEVCKQVRQFHMNDIQLILFTADQRPETRSKAIAAGANEVVVKSANASDIINSVIKQLNKKN